LPSPLAYSQTDEQEKKRMWEIKEGPCFSRLLGRKKRKKKEKKDSNQAKDSLKKSKDPILKLGGGGSNIHIKLC